MPLFINDKDHLHIFKNDRGIKEQNQSLLKKDPLWEYIKIQQDEMNQHYIKSHELQVQHLNAISSQLSDLKLSSLKHEEFTTQIAEKITTLNNKDQHIHKVLDEDRILNQEIFEQIRLQQQKIEALTQRLEHYESTEQKRSEQVENQLQISKTMQIDIVDRLNKQEALMEKVARQINHIRSILFERTNYLASKIEEGYKFTSSYVYRLMTGSDQPLTFLMVNDRKNETDKKVKE